MVTLISPRRMKRCAMSPGCEVCVEKNVLSIEIRNILVLAAPTKVKSALALAVLQSKTDSTKPEMKATNKVWWRERVCAQNIVLTQRRQLCNPCDCTKRNEHRRCSCPRR